MKELANQPLKVPEESPIQTMVMPPEALLEVLQELHPRLRKAKAFLITYAMVEEVPGNTIVFGHLDSKMSLEDKQKVFLQWEKLLFGQ